MMGCIIMVRSGARLMVPSFANDVAVQRHLEF